VPSRNGVPKNLISKTLTVIAILFTWSARPTAQSSLAGDTIHISRTTAPIVIDGDISDQGWRNATRIDKWYETKPGDNVEPKVRNVGYLTYDDHFFMIGRKRVGYIAQFSPSHRVTLLSIDATSGQEIDFDNARPGTGSTINLQATLNPTIHLNLDLVQNQRWVNVLDTNAVSRRLFIARVSRFRGTYTFTARLFARGIVQYVSTTRDVSLYIDPATIPREGTLSAQALLSYKLNWQSVLFVGYGDDRDRTEQNQLVKTGRQVFVKASYAFQR